MDHAAPFDASIAEGVRNADPDALGAVYAALAVPLASWIRSQVGDPDLAQDLAEDTFLEFVRGCRSVRGDPFEIRGWLFRAARRNIADHRRQQARRREDVTAEMPDSASAALSPAAAAEAVDDATRLHASLAALTPAQREVVTLRYLAELSVREVAHAVGRSEAAVRVLTHRGTANLARHLQQDAADEAPTARGRPAEVAL